MKPIVAFLTIKTCCGACSTHPTRGRRRSAQRRTRRHHRACVTCLQKPPLYPPADARKLGRNSRRLSCIITNYLTSLASVSFFDRALPDNAFTPGLVGTNCHHHGLCDRQRH